MQALTIIKESTEDCSRVVIITDALSVLEALLNCKLPSLSRILGQLCNTRRMALQWIPAHCGIPGNEKADKLAKHGAGGIQPQNNISYEEKVTVIKTMMKRRPAKDDYHLLDRQEQVTIFRLRTGHNRLNAHMHSKFKLCPSPQCSCGMEQQTAEHIFRALDKLFFQGVLHPLIFKPMLIFKIECLKIYKCVLNIKRQCIK